MTSKLTSSLEVKTDIWELMGAGVFKHFSERFLSRYIGNGTLTSGLVKLGIPIATEMMLPASYRRNILYKIPKTALIIDGSEDIVKYIMDRFVNKGSSNTQTNSGFNII